MALGPRKHPHRFHASPHHHDGHQPGWYPNGRTPIRRRTATRCFVGSPRVLALQPTCRHARADPHRRRPVLNLLPSLPTRPHTLYDFFGDRLHHISDCYPHPCARPPTRVDCEALYNKHRWPLAPVQNTGRKGNTELLDVSGDTPKATFFFLQ